MYISSAALCVDGRIVAGAAEERFTRQKATRAFPRNAVAACLQSQGLSIGDIDHFATAWNPAIYMRKFNPLVSAQRRSKSEYLYSVPDNLLDLFDAEAREIGHVHQVFGRDGGKDLSVYHVTHHRAHAANAYHLSGFDEAAIMTADSQGEAESTSFAAGRGNRIDVLATLLHPHSLGAYYATFTDFLGFRPHHDEWKVMALSAYADGAASGLIEVFRREFIQLEDDGAFRLNLKYFKDFLHDLPNLYTPEMEALLGPARQPDSPLEARHYRIAAAMQTQAEEVALHALRALHRRTGCDALCVSGGFFMNAALNGKILRRTPFSRLFVSPAPDDSGNAMGAALHLHHQILGTEGRHALATPYLGPEYDKESIAAAVAACGLTARRSAAVVDETAEALANGELVGWFQGAMEVGQRALGNRSILADPRRADVKDRVNRSIKFRESFRPFAPAVPLTNADAYFDLLPGEQVPYMEKIVPVRPERRQDIPAVVHRDGSARVQTVTPESNPRFHALLTAFGARTGIPVLLNTSFNLNGEPIVATPLDAIRTFSTSGLDRLVLGDHVVVKRG